MTMALDTDPDAARDAPIPPPAPEAASWLALHPNSLIVGRLSSGARTAALGVAVFAGLIFTTLGARLSAGRLMLLAGGGVALIAAAALAAWIVPERRYRYTRYRLDDLGLSIRRGRLFRSEVAVLRSRVQHTDVTQGPIERAFGLGTLVVYTAGTAHAEIDLAGISWDEARRLRAELTGLDTGADGI
jgi:membrane protein YdbS with pleckstrin-like domain